MTTTPTTATVNSISFVLPGLPPSCNELYSFIPARGSGGKIVYSMKMRDDVLRWRVRMFDYVPPFRFAAGSLFRLDWIIAYDCFYKNENLRRVDSSNFQKALHDLVAKKLGFDDSRIKSGSFTTVHGKDEQVMVTLVEVPMSTLTSASEASHV